MDQGKGGDADPAKTNMEEQFLNTNALGMNLQMNLNIAQYSQIALVSKHFFLKKINL